MQGYLHFGGAATVDGAGSPMVTHLAPVKETETPQSGQTVTGYGAKLPTPYLVKWAGQWRRVYAACYGNAASHYIGKPGAWLATFDLKTESI